MTPQEMAEKYHTILVEDVTNHAKNQIASAHKRGLPVQSDNSSVVHFHPTAPIPMDSLRQYAERIAKTATDTMLFEIWRNKGSYEYTIETLCRAMQLQNESLSAIPLADFMLDFQTDYPHSKWEADNQIFAQSQDQTIR
jgi:hypothetical protein